MIVAIQLKDSDAEVDPVPTSATGGKQEAELDLPSAILNNFNDLFGNIEWSYTDHVRRQIAEIPAMVANDEKYQNAMKNSDKQNARIESEWALKRVMFNIMADNMELFKQFNMRKGAGEIPRWQFTPHAIA